MANACVLATFCVIVSGVIINMSAFCIAATSDSIPQVNVDSLQQVTDQTAVNGSARAAIQSGIDTTPVHFDTEIVPIFTKIGCNAGSCHGSAKGRGDFKLSLWGSDAAGDYDAIVKHLQSRRVNFVKPERSLIVLKPSDQVEHEGGYKLRRDSKAHALLLAWIKQGAPRVDGRKLQSLAVSFVQEGVQAIDDNSTKDETQDQIRQASLTSMTPRITRLGSKVQLRAVATFNDQMRVDVTQWTVFSVSDRAATSVNKHSEVSVKRPGMHVITARYLDRIGVVRLIVPIGDENVQLQADSSKRYIDKRIHKMLSMLKLPAAGRCDDETFIRRVHLDLIGQLPKPIQVLAFSKSKQNGKRAQLIQQLMKSDAFADFWAYKLAGLFQINSKRLGATGAKVFHNWLREQISEGVGFDKMVTAMLTATGDSSLNGAVNFARIEKTPRLQAEFFSQSLMGVRLRCANCHDHPLDRWKQDDYHGLASMFAQISTGQIVTINKSQRVTHPKTGKPALPRLPGKKPLPDIVDAQQAVATWLTDASNPYFARAMTNRLWQHMMGRGLVEPVDDHRATNPPTHPDLLAALANDFKTHGFDLRRTLGAIANSNAYQRAGSFQSVSASRAVIASQYYASMPAKPLSAAVLADAIGDATGVPIAFKGQPIGSRAVTLADPLTPSRSLDVLGRCDRQTTCATTSSAKGNATSLSRALHLINGELLNQRVVATNKKGLLAKLTRGKWQSKDVVSHLYLATLSRKPTSKELAFWKNEIDQADDAKNKRQVCEDLLWALLSCEAFGANH